VDLHVNWLSNFFNQAGTFSTEFTKNPQ